MFMNKIYKILIFNFLFLHIVYSQDYGIRGNTFEIIEEDILKSIKQSLVNFNVNEYQEQIKKEAIKSINRPKGIFLPRAIENKSFMFDPSIVTSIDLKDHTGKIFAFKGSKVNPLKYTNLRETLIFIDGDDKSQVDFALRVKGLKQIILVKGEVLKLNKNNDDMFFFDFDGSLIKRFGIQRLPSLVKQKGEMLEINEVKL
jgi:conjugal transfer pilus assembly protein TraW